MIVEKSKLRLWDAIVTPGKKKNKAGKKVTFKITAVFEGIHLFEHLGKTGCHIILRNKNKLCQPQAAPQTF